MLEIPPAAARKPRPRIRRRPPPGPVALTLVEASFDWGGQLVTLRFDRPVDASAFAPGRVTVFDGVASVRFDGVGVAAPPDAESVRVEMFDTEEWLGAGIRLTVSAPTGIVAADDGAAWAGVADLPLPFP